MEKANKAVEEFCGTILSVMRQVSYKHEDFTKVMNAMAWLEGLQAAVASERGQEAIENMKEALGSQNEKESTQDPNTPSSDGIDNG